METDASEQTATLSTSHEIGGGSAGARSGYRPDPKRARDKFDVASSDSRDQAQMASEPENPVVAVGGGLEHAESSQTRRRPLAARQ